MGLNGFRILVADDDASIRQMLSLGLKQEGYTVETVENGESALSLIPRFNPHVVILDLMMPVMDGHELCLAIPDISQAAMIMLTAKKTTTDIVQGLRLGAHDYLVKPFHFVELLARIEVQLRIRFPDLSGKQTVGSFCLDDIHHVISYDDRPINLSPTEYKLLAYFLANPTQVLSKTAIINHVWGYDFNGEENVVEVYVRYLREKLEDKDHALIQTVRGAGYRLNPLI
ncbi:MAG: response regulator transcription factor [Desulfitobacteriaceae bacterium]